jgi:hypothetical protein
MPGRRPLRHVCFLPSPEPARRPAASRPECHFQILEGTHMLESLADLQPQALAQRAACPPDGPGAPCPGHRTVTTDDVARFVRDPFAFASSAGAAAPDAFVKTYLRGLEARLSGVVGAPPAARYRLATLTADALPVGDLVELPEGERVGELDRSPRMGPVVAAAVVTAACAVVTAACAVASLALAKHDAN